jgi:hypothetical protein
VWFLGCQRSFIRSIRDLGASCRAYGTPGYVQRAATSLLVWNTVSSVIGTRSEASRDGAEGDGQPTVGNTAGPRCQGRLVDAEVHWSCVGGSGIPMTPSPPPRIPEKFRSVTMTPWSGGAEPRPWWRRLTTAYPEHHPWGMPVWGPSWVYAESAASFNRKDRGLTHRSSTP